MPKALDFTEIKEGESYCILTGLQLNPIVENVEVCEIRKDKIYGRNDSRLAPEVVKVRFNHLPLFFKSELEAREELRWQLETFLAGNQERIEVLKKWRVDWLSKYNPKSCVYSDQPPPGIFDVWKWEKNCKREAAPEVWNAD